MKKRQLTKNEILSRIKQVKLMTINSYRAPFTAMSVLCNYILWTEEKWGQTKLARYNQQVADYESKLDKEEIDIQGLSKRLMDKAEFTVEHVAWTEKDIKARKKSFMYEMEKMTLESENKINELSSRYLLINFNVLMDEGYGKKRLDRFKNYLNTYFENIYTDDGTHIMEFRQKLIDEVGIFIEMPSYEI